MPFREIEQNGVLTSDDLDFLQDIYNAAVADVASVDDARIHEVARTLIVHYQAGECDRDKLVAIALRDLERASG